MSYSYRRFRRVLAIVRIVFGLVFLYTGATRLFDPSALANWYESAVPEMTHAAAAWYSPVISSMSAHGTPFTMLIGVSELFIGMGLFLGLATRPVCLAGLIYMGNVIASSWRPAVSNPSTWNYVEAHFPQLAILFIFLIFALEHAGETWGLGAIYHSHRFIVKPMQESEAAEVYEQDDAEQELAEVRELQTRSRNIS